jgi:Neuraminidase (sialidase)
MMNNWTLCFVLLSLFPLLFCTPLVHHTQWEPERRLTFNDSTSVTSDNNAKCIAVSGDTVHVVWYDTRDGKREVYYKRSTDGGNTWGSDVRLTKSPVLSCDPSIASMGPDVHVAWVNLWKGNYEIFYKRSMDGGTTWGPDTSLTKDTLASVEPSIAVSGANVYVVWKYALQRDRSSITKEGEEIGAYGPRGICYRRSTDKGTTWDSKVLLSGKPIFAEYPSVGVSGENVHVV